MLRKNNGSVLIISLIIFSLVGSICIAAISLVHNTISSTNLETTNLKLKEKALSSIDIVYINMLNEVELAIDSTNNSQEFVNYFRNDNFKAFLSKCKDMSKSDLSGVEVELTNKTPFGESSEFDFQLKVVSNEGVYKKDILVDVKVNNPWSKFDLSKLEIAKESNINKDKENIEIYKIQNLENDDNLDKIKEDFKRSNLINMYNYEEL